MNKDDLVRHVKGALELDEWQLRSVSREDLVEMTKTVLNSSTSSEQPIFVLFGRARLSTWLVLLTNRRVMLVELKSRLLLETFRFDEIARVEHRHTDIGLVLKNGKDWNITTFGRDRAGRFVAEFEEQLGERRL